MKNFLLAILILFSIIKTKAQCGTFPFSVFEPTITCTSYTGAIVITTTVSPISCTWANTPNIVSGGNTLNPTVNSPGSYSFTLTNTNNGCATSGIANVSMNASIPSLSVTSSGSICTGSSATLYATVSSTNNTSILWSNGSSSSSISVSPTLTTNYSITATDVASGCLTMLYFTVYVNQTCQDVWPGDANSDGAADNLDILELGLHYNQTGPARAATSNSWQSYFSNNWGGTISSGKNLNHSDCNGDGTINNNDTLAIYTNYGLIHSFKSNQQIATNPQLSIVPDQAAVAKGVWGTASVYLGDSGNPVYNINGLAFTVNFDHTLIETNSVWIEYPVSFINSTNQDLKFRKLDFYNDHLYTAITHTISNNVSGNGLIAVLHYQIKSSLTTDQVLDLGIFEAYSSNAAGLITPLTSGTGTLMAMSSVGINELSNSSLSIYPTPTKDRLTIQSDNEFNKIELTNITGQTLISETVNNKTYILNLSTVTSGIYFLNVYKNGRLIKQHKVVVAK